MMKFKGKEFSERSFNYFRETIHDRFKAPLISLTIEALEDSEELQKAHQRCSDALDERIQHNEKDVETLLALEWSEVAENNKIDELSVEVMGDLFRCRKAKETLARLYGKK